MQQVHRKYAFQKSQTTSSHRLFRFHDWRVISIILRSVHFRQICRCAFPSCGRSRDFPFCSSELSSKFLAGASAPQLWVQVNTKLQHLQTQLWEICSPDALRGSVDKEHKGVAKRSRNQGVKPGPLKRRPLKINQIDAVETGTNLRLDTAVCLHRRKQVPPARLQRVD